MSILLLGGFVLGGGGGNVPQPLSPYPAGGGPGGPWPLTHARILYRNRLIGAVVTPSDAAVTLIPNTWERYVATDPVILYEASTPGLFDAVGIAAHNLGGKVLTVEYQAEEAGPFIEIYSGTPENDAAILILLDTATTGRALRVSAEGDDVEIGVVYAGLALQMQRPTFAGHRPINLSRRTVYDNNTSDAGQFLGRNIVRQGLATSYSWKYLEDTWIRNYFEPFATAAQTVPFFIAWRPEDYPTEVAFGWTEEDIAPENMGQNKFMSVSFNLKAYGSE